MPQLDPGSFSSQLFWLIISFSLLYLFVSKYALSKIGKVLRQRQDRIQSDIEQAEGLKEEAMYLKEEYEVSLRETREKASETIIKATYEAADRAAARHLELDAVLKEKLAKYEENIKKAEKKAVNAFIPVSAQLSQEIVKKLTNLKVQNKQAEEAVNQLLKEAR